MEDDGTAQQYLLATNAVSWAKAKGLHNAALVVGKTSLCSDPALWNEFVHVDEIVGVAEDGVVVDSHGGLQSRCVSQDVVAITTKQKTYVRRDVLSANHVVLACLAQKGARHRRIKTEGLVNTGEHVV